ncbi:hypothetical protein L596_024680 [Steinernema carpocapsae]|uniref:Uncharacterized protein n=1 Tax=Steinernema carpocapsae TaxID=34508 RepID=A0A4U5M5F8_STECR|nr:hypothetical protein L596_024680 [Steinernema carpocapsae]
MIFSSASFLAIIFFSYSHAHRPARVVFLLHLLSVARLRRRVLLLLVAPKLFSQSVAVALAQLSPAGNRSSPSSSSVDRATQTAAEQQQPENVEVVVVPPSPLRHALWSVVKAANSDLAMGPFPSWQAGPQPRSRHRKARSSGLDLCFTLRVCVKWV